MFQYARDLQSIVPACCNPYTRTTGTVAGFGPFLDNYTQMNHQLWGERANYRCARDTVQKFKIRLRKCAYRTKMDARGAIWSSQKERGRLKPSSDHASRERECEAKFVTSTMVQGKYSRRRFAKVEHISTWANNSLRIRFHVKYELGLSLPLFFWELASQFLEHNVTNGPNPLFFEYYAVY